MIRPKYGPLSFLSNLRRVKSGVTRLPVKGRRRVLSLEVFEQRQMLAAASITGIKFETVNSSGFSAGDVPQGGVFIDLYKDNGDSIFNPATDTLVDRQQTAGGTGAYTFGDVADGHYFIQEEVPTGYTQSAGPAFYTLDVVDGAVYTGTAQNIDNFSDPDPSRTYFINGVDPNPLLMQDSGPGILGNQRDLLVKVLGVSNPISANGFVGTVSASSGVFNLGTASSGPGTEVTMQYDGLDADTTALNNAKLLSTDLTANGNNGIRLDFNFLQVGAGTTMGLAVNATSPGGGTAAFSVSITENNGKFSVFIPFSSFATTGTFSFANVDSLQLAFNSSGVQDVDYELDQIVNVNQTNSGYNFGNFPLPSSLAGFVYVDLNNNGNKDLGEPPIVGVKVTLNGVDNLGQNVTQSTTTDALGAYSFTNLRTGIYSLTESQPINFIDGKDTIGTPGGDTSNDKFFNINLPTDFDGVNNNFGELGLVPKYVSKRALIEPSPPVVLTAVYDTVTPVVPSTPETVTAAPATLAATPAAATAPVAQPQVASKTVAPPVATPQVVAQPQTTTQTNAKAQASAQPQTTTRPVLQPASTSRPVFQSQATSRPALQPPVVNRPTLQSATTNNLVKQQVTTTQKVAQPTTAAKAVAPPVATPQVVAQPQTTVTKVVQPTAAAKAVVQTPAATKAVAQPQVVIQPAAAPVSIHKSVAVPQSTVKPASQSLSTPTSIVHQPADEPIMPSLRSLLTRSMANRS